MKKYFLVLLLASFWQQITPTVAQINPSNVEIWGLPTGLTREDFVTTLNQKKATVCMATIRPMGYKDAQVIWLADDEYLVTLRSDTGTPYRTAGAPDPRIVAKLNAAVSMQQLQNIEFQMARRSLSAIRAQDTAAVAAVRRNYPQHQAAHYTQALELLQAPKALTVAQAVAILRSTAPDSVREKAFMQAGAQARTATEMYQLLPFLRDPDLGTGALQYIQGFFRYHPVKATDWPRILPECVQALNTPNPIVAAGVATFLHEQKVPRQYSPELMGRGSNTIREILRGEHPSLEVYKQPMYPFLSYLAGSSITTFQDGLAYLSSFRGR